MKTTMHILVFLSGFAFILGCNRNPNVEIVGSYFPGWMISLAVALLFTFITHMLLRRQGLNHVIGQPAVVYPSIVLLFTCLLWLCIFA